ncbi:uncharacterized protein N7473_011189 [Penicillium subrubescens]|uniref:uncharacterized protein n=1 Tax=Penicillium subrubescens TaxID=1316194 RepID=UPI002545A5A9|nr:uncharacterized protein N7473_013116 [Penicillium subrubescens]XP_057004250.1 uncharacterized protein N7473_011189 [Penicillium subrubescens]KAJ5875003.1 hypothetical protein N7473_013116 [Penicillium subrubescens]KAJ5882755.1 hypothetical protein N7473_011189 [Penicillium subrubescens]
MPVTTPPERIIATTAWRSPSQVEVEKLLQCCKNAGFFYLDLEGKRILDDHQELLTLMHRFFGSPLEQKNEILSDPSVEHGYEPVGNHAGVVNGTKDGYEILQVAPREIEKRNPKLHSILDNEKDIATLYNFIADSNFITKTILSCLSTALGREGMARFETTHSNEKPSKSALAMMRYLPGDLKSSKKIGHLKHTDIGSLTLLFSEQWGLQILPPRSDTWEFVEPKKGYAVVNVGDSLHFASDQEELFSCIHRVVPVDNKSDRYSVAFFLRPADDAEFVDHLGRRITAGKWHEEKFNVFEAEDAEQKMNAILVGGMKDRSMKRQSVL